jgi:hypothetical protein
MRKREVMIEHVLFLQLADDKSKVEQAHEDLKTYESTVRKVEEWMHDLRSQIIRIRRRADPKEVFFNKPN